ncbi:MAG: hypothetical protein RL708_1163 [Bacteroidota bacterium]|jgi:hypothetical protein
MKNVIRLFIVFIWCILVSINHSSFAQSNNTNCENQKVIEAIQKSVTNFESKGYIKINGGSEAYVSTNENRHSVELKAGKTYLILLKTEPYVDQSSISVLNSYNVVVESTFRETGKDRNSVLLQYVPNFTGKYTIVLKMVDYSERTVCGTWVILEK